MKRILLVLGAVYWSGVLVAAASAAEVSSARPSAAKPFPDTSKMNILFIDIEDCRADAWGCYGNPICKTPNIDRLAATGVLFNHAYCQGVCCNPSRNSFLTGTRPPTTGVYHNTPDEFDTSWAPDAATLPRVAHQSGFFTANVAKLFHRPPKTSGGPLDAFDWLEMDGKLIRPEGFEPPAQLEPIPKHVRLPKLPPRGTAGYRKQKQWRSDRYGDSGLTETQDSDGRISLTACGMLRKLAESEQRFLLCVGSRRPHTPLIAPKKYIDMYDPAEIPMPQAPPADDRNVPAIAVRFGRAADIFYEKPDAQKTREAIAAYYGCVSFVDACMGRVLDTLEETGLADKTIVVFFADHGFHLGEHGLWSKYSLFEQSTRIPLIIRVPGAPANGKKCDRLVELVDLFPTLAELCRMNAPADFEGTSLKPLLIDPEQPWKTAAFTWHSGWGGKLHRSVRTERYRYSEWDNRGQQVVELYDLKSDPWETHNLADDAGMKPTRRQMAQLLAQGWKAALPTPAKSVQPKSVQP